MSSLNKGEGASGGGPGDVADGGSVKKNKLLESGERLASTRRTAGRGAVQNGSNSASNKRSGREWKTCFEEIRAGKRRILRSDMARLRAEAEAARKRSEEQGGHGAVQDDDCFEICFQNGSDWIKVGEDVKAEKKEELKSDVAKKTEESDTHLENDTEEALLNDDQLRKNSSTSKRGEGEEMEAVQRLVKSCVLEQMEDPNADEQKTAEEFEIREKKAIKVAESEKKKSTEESDSDLKKVTEESGSVKGELAEVSDTSLKKVTGELASRAYQCENSCAIIERVGREQIKCGDMKEVEMSGTVGLDVTKKREEEDTDGKEVIDYKSFEADENTNNSINKSNGIKWMKCKETKVDRKRVTRLDISRGKEDGESDSKEVGEDNDTNLKKGMEENDTDKIEATEETIPGADQHGKSGTIIRRSCRERMKRSNEFEVENRIMKLDAANQRGEVDIVEKEVSEEAASGVQHNRKTITGKRNNVNHENEVEKRITRSAAAKQRKETDTEKNKVKEEADGDDNEATDEFVPGADQNGNISTVHKRIGMEQTACEEEINIERKQIVGMDAAYHSKEARTCRKKVKKEAGSRIGAEDMEQIKHMETKLDNKQIMGLNLAKQRRETIMHKKKVMKDSVSAFTQNKKGSSISKSNGPEQISFEEIKINNQTCIKSNNEKEKRDIDTIKKVMKSGLNKKRGRETSDSETTRKKIKSESLKCRRDQTEEFSGKKISFDSSNSRGSGCKSEVRATGQKDDLDEKTILRSTRGQGRVASNKTVDGFEKVHVLSEDGDNKRNRGFPAGSHSISKHRILSVKREVPRKSRGVKMEHKSLSPQVAPLNLKSSNGKRKVMVKQESSSIRRSKKNKGTAGEGRKEAKDKVREQIKNILLSAGWRIDLRPRRGKNYEDSVYVSPRGSGYWSITKAYEVFQMEFNHTHSEKGNDVSRSSSKSSKRSEGLGFPFSAIPIEDLSMLKKKIGKRSKDKFEKSKKKLGDGSRSKKLKKAGKKKYLKYKDNGGETKGKVKENDTAGSGSKDIAGNAPKKLHSGRHKKRRGCALLVRGSKQESETGSDGYVPYVWKRTILSWMIDLGIVPSNGKVKYMNQHTEAVLEGWITRDGIKCSCCNKILAVPKFEIHAGSILSHPYQNIFVEETGVSLSECLLDAWKKQDESERQGFYTVDIDGDDPNDDTCGICGDGGDLICCDSCPSTFHLNCLGFQMLPPGDWHCMNCSCRFCGVSSGSVAQENGGTDSPLLTCSQCEEKYHQTCAAKLDDASVSSSLSWAPFCECSCKEIFERLQRLLGVKNDLEAGFSWTLVQRFDEDSPEPACGLDQRAECNSKIAVALAVMHECFSPVMDQRSGINLIHNVIYNRGSNFNRLNFCGFYTFILEREDEIISAASLRIHGTRLAEMPFIGTRNMYRRQGMCRRLLAGIESVLCSLNIERLVIPAVSELKETWTNVFGFQPLEVSQKQEIRSLNIVVFPETCLLQKPLLKEDSTHQSKTAGGVDKVVAESKHHHTLKVANESSFCSFVESVPQAAIMTTVQCEHEIKQRESRNGCTLSTFDMSAESSDAPCGSKFEASDYRPLETAADEDLMLLPKAVYSEEPVVRSKFQQDSAVETETSLLCLGTKYDNNNAKIVEAGISRDLLASNETSGIFNSMCTSPIVIASNLQDSCVKDLVNFPANDGNHNPKDQIAVVQPNCQAFHEDSTHSNSEMVAEPLNTISPLDRTSLPEPDVHSDEGLKLGISHKTNDDAGHAEQNPRSFGEGPANHAIKKFTSLNAASESDFLSLGGLKSSKKVASKLPDSSSVPNDLTC